MGWLSGIPIVGDVISSVFDNQNQQHAQENAQNFSSDQAAANRDFQERMSNTSHQREVTDLKAAGLNPILSAGGSGSSTPGGSAPSGVQAPTTKLPEFFPVFSALTQLEQQQQRIDIEKTKAIAEIDKKGTDIDLNKVKKEMLMKGMPAAEVAKDVGEFYKSAKEYIRDGLKNSPTERPAFDNTNRYKEIINQRP